MGKLVQTCKYCNAHGCATRKKYFTVLAIAKQTGSSHVLKLDTRVFIKILCEIKNLCSFVLECIMSCYTVFFCFLDPPDSSVADRSFCHFCTCSSNHASIHPLFSAVIASIAATQQVFASFCFYYVHTN